MIWFIERSKPPTFTNAPVCRDLVAYRNEGVGDTALGGYCPQVIS